jgi:hypothetical protein
MAKASKRPGRKESTRKPRRQKGGFFAYESKATREQVARALASFRRNLKGVQWDPNSSFRLAMVTYAKELLAQAIDDTKALDLAVKHKGEKPYWLRTLDLSLPLATVSLWAMVCHRFWNTKLKNDPALNAARSGANSAVRMSKWAARRFKEKLMDGLTPNEALASEAGILKAMAKNNMMGRYLLELGNITLEWEERGRYRQRSYPEWILRAWLPLNLWCFPHDGIEAYARLKEAADLLGHDMPSETQFRVTWKNLRQGELKTYFQWLRQQGIKLL